MPPRWQVCINSDWLSVETVVDAKVVRDLIPSLISAGAQGIIEYPLNKVINDQLEQKGTGNPAVHCDGGP